MTPAEEALANAISLEAKKDALSQRQSGDWKVSFTIQGVDMDTRLTQALPGTRYQVVLVEIGDDELPVVQPVEQPKPAPAPKGKLDWRELQPAAQAGIRAGEPEFWAYLREERGLPNVRDKATAEGAIREVCGVESRTEFATDQRSRVLWHSLDQSYLAWKALERAGG